MIRYVIAGVLLFIGFAAAFAPAGLLDRVLQQNTAADLTDTRGTLWAGQGSLLVNAMPLGRLDWDFAPSSLLRLTPRYDWYLNANDKQLQGNIAVRFGSADLSAQGTLQAAAVNPSLRLYDIFVGGQFEVLPTRLSLTLEGGTITALDGQIDWSGGLVRYTLSGLLRETTLPPLRALLSMSEAGTPRAEVYAQGEQTPLMLLSLNDNGFAKVSITKLFTKLVDNPWPGSDPDHAVVIEVEEQIF